MIKKKTQKTCLHLFMMTWKICKMKYRNISKSDIPNMPALIHDDMSQMKIKQK